MREFRKKQKKLKTIMNAVIIITAIYIFIYYGIEPMLAKAIGTGGTMVFAYVMYALVLVSLSLLFQYSSKYGKSDKFLENIEYELSDAGYYLTARPEREAEQYKKAVIDDLASNGYSINTDVTINDFEFDAACYKRKEMFYVVNISDLDKNDVIAYLDSAIYDITAVNVRRKGNGVVLFICDNADDGAVSLSKAITTMGKKEQIKFTVSIAEMSSGRVYFLGNKVSKCQQMIANYVMNCDLPIKEQYISKEQLPFQAELEEHMKSFTIKDFKNGTFFAH